MIDRPAREKMTSAIERYLAEEIDSYGFDDQIWALKSEDPAVVTVREHLTEICVREGKSHMVDKSEQFWGYYRRWMVFLRTDYQLEELDVVPAWNYPWRFRCAFSAIAMLPVFLFWGAWEEYLASCIFIALVFMWAMEYRRRRCQRLARQHQQEWRPRMELAPFLSEADWRAHESIADTMSIPPTPPPEEEECEQRQKFVSSWWLLTFLFFWLAPAWIPLHVLGRGKWQGDYTLHLRTSESDGATSSTDSP